MIDMLEKVVNKLWQGKYVSVRDYEVRKAIKQGGMIIRHKDKHMKMSADELAKLKPNPKEIQSFYKGTYKLVDIEFEPYMADKRQMNFEDILKGLQLWRDILKSGINYSTKCQMKEKKN